MAYDFVIGVDVGKYFHHACVLDPQGRQVLPKRINQHEGSLRKLFGQFLADNTSVLVIVDQPNNIGRLTVAVAQHIGQTIAIYQGLRCDSSLASTSATPRPMYATPTSSPMPVLTFQTPCAASTALRKSLPSQKFSTVSTKTSPEPTHA